VLFRVKPQVPLPTALRKLFEDPEVRVRVRVRLG